MSWLLILVGLYAKLQLMMRNDLMELLALLFIIYVTSRVVSLNRHRKQQIAEKQKPKESKKPKCDLCNDEPIYLGKSKIPCPKCKKGA